MLEIIMDKRHAKKKKKEPYLDWRYGIDFTL